MNESIRDAAAAGSGGDVDPARRPAASPVANFRVALHARGCNRATGTGSTAQTQWYTVTAWRALARQRATESLQRGDPVVVHGRLRADVWEREDGVELERPSRSRRPFVGHDLNRGTSAFAKPHADAPSRRDPSRQATASEPDARRRDPTEPDARPRRDGRSRRPEPGSVRRSGDRPARPVGLPDHG